MHIQHRMTLGWKQKGRKKGSCTGWERPTLIQQIGPATKNPPPTCIDKIPLGLTTKLPLEKKQKREERKTAGPLMILARVKRLIRRTNRPSATAARRKKKDLRTARTGSIDDALLHSSQPWKRRRIRARRHQRQWGK